MTISDTAFLEQFESQTLPPDLFDHRGHLRLTWLYLNKLPLEKAIGSITNGIAAYASSLGATDKFQHTLSEAIIRIVDLRMESGIEDTLGAFLDNNKDLVEDIWAVVGVHYSHETLTSKTARKRFVEPDLLPITSVDTI